MVNNFKLITVWKKYNDNRKQYEHNHICDGHVDGDIPIGTKEQNKNWNKSKWIKIHCYLDQQHKVVKNDNE